VVAGSEKIALDKNFTGNTMERYNPVNQAGCHSLAGHAINN
jgi:hypothetical protein